MRYIPQNKAESDFDDYIDDIHSPVSILGLQYPSSSVLKEIDPTAYACEFDNWLDANNLTTDENYSDEEE